MHSHEQLQALAHTLRRHVFTAIGPGGMGHIGGAFSAAEVVVALYFSKMRHNPAQPHWPGRDRFILSKGHAAVLQYAALAQAGYFPVDELPTFKQIGSRLQGHPDMTKTPGIDASSGSLGQGLSVGLGMALGLRLDAAGSEAPKVYVLLGDGELAEGQVWEAAMAATAYQAAGLVAIVDRNHKQAQGATADRFPIDNIPEKWAAFGWRVLHANGHCIESLLTALDAVEPGHTGPPTVIIAETVKGKGMAAAEAHEAGYHNWLLSPEEYAQETGGIPA